MTELPKIGWYVELPNNKDDIDLIKLRHALGANYSFYTDSGRNYKFYFIGSDGLSDCTYNFDRVDGLENVTHLFKKQEKSIKPDSRTLSEAVLDLSDVVKDTLLEKIQNFEEREEVIDYFFVNKERNILTGGITGSFHTIELFKFLQSVECGRIERDEFMKLLKNESKKQEQPMEPNEVKEEKVINTETIEIDGKKYRLVPEQANFKNCDLVMKDGNVYEFIGYYEADVVIKGLISGGLSQYENVGLFKLEEIKTKIWHYAIYRDEDELCHSNFYSHENLLKKDRPDALEYRTFEEQL